MINKKLLEETLKKGGSLSVGYANGYNNATFVYYFHQGAIDEHVHDLVHKNTAAKIDMSKFRLINEDRYFKEYKLIDPKSEIWLKSSKL
jgi:hypothetical protein